MGREVSGHACCARLKFNVELTVDELQTEQPARQAVQVAKTDVLVVEAVPKNPVAHYVQPREVH